MTRPLQSFAGWLLLAGLALPAGASAQSLADIARESKQKREHSTRKVWTNEELGTAFPTIHVVGSGGPHPWLGIFDSTPMVVVDGMLRAADVQPGEVVFDLGSGDGRFVIMAAERFKARGVGIEIDPALVAASRKEIEAKGLQEQVKIIHADVFDVDLSPADVVTLYVGPATMETLRKYMERYLRPGTRVVSFRFQVTGWEPELIVEVEGYFIYLYRTK